MGKAIPSSLSPEARALWLDMQRKRRERNALVARLAREPGGIVLGQQRHDGSWMGAVVTRSMEEAGCWRVTFFDDWGFSGHTIRKTRLEALQLAVREGYRDEDRGLLHRLSKLPSFRASLAA